MLYENSKFATSRSRLLPKTDLGVKIEIENGQRGATLERLAMAQTPGLVFAVIWEPEGEMVVFSEPQLLEMALGDEKKNCLPQQRQDPAPLNTTHHRRPDHGLGVGSTIPKPNIRCGRYTEFNDSYTHTPYPHSYAQSCSDSEVSSDYEYLKGAVKDYIFVAHSPLDERKRLGHTQTSSTLLGGMGDMSLWGNALPVTMPVLRRDQHQQHQEKCDFGLSAMGNDLAGCVDFEEDFAFDFDPRTSFVKGWLMKVTNDSACAVEETVKEPEVILSSAFSVTTTSTSNYVTIDNINDYTLSDENECGGELSDSKSCTWSTLEIPMTPGFFLSTFHSSQQQQKQNQRHEYAKTRSRLRKRRRPSECTNTNFVTTPPRSQQPEVETESNRDAETMGRNHCRRHGLSGGSLPLPNVMSRWWQGTKKWKGLGYGESVDPSEAWVWIDINLEFKEMYISCYA